MATPEKLSSQVLKVVSPDFGPTPTYNGKCSCLFRNPDPLERWRHLASFGCWGFGGLALGLLVPERLFF